ncbi:Shedu anti-phage system protein SduA domain-containing protein [Burkholderia gladioli]|uniref:Shedu anti-phage system protein SduA domain-containing protein n=1 Tax=Burkholderia gladioli TaxID=28095 RepID=UPI003F7A04CE
MILTTGATKKKAPLKGTAAAKKSPARTVGAAPGGPPFAGNLFHPFDFKGSTTAGWRSDWTIFKSMIWTASTPKAPVSVEETELLKWFGGSVERVAMMVYAIHKIVPTHVARELEIGDFRADFAWASIDPDADATVGFIEFENCLPKTIFDKKTRKAPYWGSRFLGGFGQLVDWCAFGQAQAQADAAISSILGPKFDNARYVYSLVAGHRAFWSDALSSRRMNWWSANMSLGSGTTTLTFDQLEQEGSINLKLLEKART